METFLLMPRPAATPHGGKPFCPTAFRPLVAVRCNVAGEKNNRFFRMTEIQSVRSNGIYVNVKIDIHCMTTISFAPSAHCRPAASDGQRSWARECLFPDRRP